MSKDILIDCTESPDGVHLRTNIGLALVDHDTGFVQVLSRCMWCGREGQSPTMYNPESIPHVNLSMIEGCIHIRNGKRVNVSGGDYDKTRTIINDS